MVVKKIGKGYESVIGAVDPKKILVCRLVDWNLILIKLNKDGPKCTIVHFNPLERFYLKQKLDKRAFQAIYEKLYKPAVSDCFEVIDGGDVENFSDCIRIMAALPVPEKKADHEMVRKFTDAKMLEFLSSNESIKPFSNYKNSIKKGQ